MSEYNVREASSVLFKRSGFLIGWIFLLFLTLAFAFSIGGGLIGAILAGFILALTFNFKNPRIRVLNILDAVFRDTSFSKTVGRDIVSLVYWMCNIAFWTTIVQGMVICSTGIPQLGVMTILSGFVALVVSRLLLEVVGNLCDKH